MQPGSVEPWKRMRGDAFYDTDESWKRRAMWQKPVTRIIRFMIPCIANVQNRHMDEPEPRFVVGRAGGVADNGNDGWWVSVFSGGTEDDAKIVEYEWHLSQSFLNVLNIKQLH